MHPVEKYFSGEKAESYLFLALGIVGLALSIYLIIGYTSSFYKGITAPFVLVSILEIIVGTTIISRSPKDIIQVENYIQQDRTKIKTEEIPRMERVMRNFVIFRYTELVLILLGIILYFVHTDISFWKGLGLGLIIQVSIVLSLDYFAEKRGFIYLEYLYSIHYE